MKPETRVRLDCREVATQLGFAVWDTEQGYRPGRGGSRVTPGLADLILIGRGAVVFVEAKAGRGKQSLAQVQFEQTCQLNAVPYILANSAAEMVQGLQELGLVRSVET